MSTKDVIKEVGSLSIDGNRVVYRGTDISKLPIVKKIDWESLTLHTVVDMREFGYIEYYTDKKRVYYGAQSLTELPGLLPERLNFPFGTKSLLANDGQKLFGSDKDVSKTVDVKSFTKWGTRLLYLDEFGSFEYVDFYTDKKQVYKMDGFGMLTVLPKLNPKIFYPFQSFTTDYNSVPTTYYDSDGHTYLADGKTASLLDPRLVLPYIISRYDVKNGQVYFNNDVVMTGVDLATFTVPYPENLYSFAKDKKYLFSEGKIIKNGDPRTFVLDKRAETTLAKVVTGELKLSEDEPEYLHARDKNQGYLVEIHANEQSYSSEVFPLVGSNGPTLQELQVVDESEKTGVSYAFATDGKKTWKYNSLYTEPLPPTAKPAEEPKKVKTATFPEAYQYITSSKYFSGITQKQAINLIPKLHVLGYMQDRTYLGVWFSDGSNVYFWHGYWHRITQKESHFLLLKGATSKAWQRVTRLGHAWSRSGTQFYYGGVAIPKIINSAEISYLGTHLGERLAISYTDCGAPSTHYYADKKTVFRVLPAKSGASVKIEVFPKQFTPSNTTVFKQDGICYIAAGTQVYLYDGKTKVSKDPRGEQMLSRLYRVVDTQIKYQKDGKWVAVAGANPKTFAVPYSDQQPMVGVDKKHVYIGGKIAKEIDAKTFAFHPLCIGPKALKGRAGGGLYATDKNHAYVLSEAHPGLYKVLPTKEPTKLKFYVDKKRGNYGFATDGEYEFNGGSWTKLKTIAAKAEAKKAAVANATILYWNKQPQYAHDGKLVYQLRKIISKKTYAKADVLGKYVLGKVIATYSANNLILTVNGQRYRGRKIRGADPKSFVVHSPSWASDKNRVYLYGTPKSVIDPKTFVHLQYLSLFHDYAKDKNNVYDVNRWKVVSNADAATFTVVHPFWAKDKHGYFCLHGRERLKQIDQATFKITNQKTGDAEDAKRIYKLHRDGDVRVTLKKKK